MATGFTKAAYREQIAYALGGLMGDAATGGSTTTIVDSKLSRFPDDHFNGMNVYIKSAGNAAPQGETSWVVDFASATGTLTLSPALSTAVEAGDTYQVYTRVSKADIDAALDSVCAGYEVATSLTPKMASLDYYVTDAALLLRRQQIIGVWLRRHSDVETLPVEVHGWQFEDAEGQLTFRMPYTLNEDDQLWLIYYAAEHPIGENDTLSLPLALVQARAMVWLIQNKLNNTTDRDWWGTQLRYWSEKAAQEERRLQRASTKAKRLDWDKYAGQHRFDQILKRLAIDADAYLLND
jgi:hypothetical protein